MQTKSRVNVLIAFSLVSFLRTVANAECVACTMSHGVQIKLRSGEVQSGYLAWNSFYFEELIGCYGLRNVPDAKPILQEWDKLPEREAFGRWVDALNLVIRNRILLQPGQSLPRFTLFRKLVKINYPFEKFVSIDGETFDLSISSIASLGVEPALDLNVDTTGMDSLPLIDAKLLRDEKPRFTVEEEQSTGATVYAVYGTKASLTDVLEHIMSVSGSSHGTIIVNRIPVIGRGGWAPTPPPEGSEPLGVLAEECAAFAQRVDSFEKPKWKSLGSMKEMRRRGVIRFVYAWD